MSAKPKLGVYWAASCGGCEIALANLHERILEVDQAFEFFFCPCLLDTKKAEVEALPDGGLAITFFNGAIRTDDNQEMAELLRRKSQVLVAFGACATQGGIPALSNLHHREDHLRTAFQGGPTVDNPAGVLPQRRSRVREGELELPEFHERVKTLAQVVEVDYSIPGCPPESPQIWNAVAALANGQGRPPIGTVLGAGKSTVCEECDRRKENKTIARLHRTFQILPDRERCLLEQGLVCMGVATREGCGALCPRVNMPCTGCYGPPEGVLDQGAKMLAAVGSALNLGGYKGLSEQQTSEKTDALLEGLPDLAGTFYRYSAAGSALGGRVG